MDDYSEREYHIIGSRKRKRDADHRVRFIFSEPPPADTETKEPGLNINERRCLSNVEALALFIDCDLTEQTYTLIRNKASALDNNIFPEYRDLEKSEKECYPAEEYIKVNKTGASIDVQSIMDHTCRRLLSMQQDALSEFSGDDHFVLTSKWGCDGSGGHNKYKLKYQNNDNVDDEFFFMFTFVPLQLRELNDETSIVWRNPRPTSKRLCRPLKFLFQKDSTDMTNRETEKITEEIDNLGTTEIRMNGKRFFIHHKMLLTMVDGKICNALTGQTSTKTCYICGAIPRTMICEPVLDDCSIENYSFGLAMLHAWVRTFDCFLNISYKLNVKKWCVRNSSDKEEIEKRKGEIEKTFWAEMGLNVGRPQLGSGSTNDEYRARLFFMCYKQSAEITGIDEQLLERFYYILAALSSGYDINIDAFEEFVSDTRTLYISLYGWYHMPVTVHKILFHSVDIVKSHQLPIGILSEDAQEALIEDAKKFLATYDVIHSRVSINRDLFLMLLKRSDPLVNSYRSLPEMHENDLPLGALVLTSQPASEFSDAEESD